MRAVEEIKPADPGRDRHDGGRPPEHLQEPASRPARSLLVAASALLVGLWIGVGVHGLVSYGHAYIKYRGFSPPKDARGVPVGRTITVHFYSTSLRQRRLYEVYLPPGYARLAARGARFPVVYLLHGSPGGPSLFSDAANMGVDEDRLLADHSIRPFLAVMPNGRDKSFISDTEWADTPHGRYEGFVLDVVRDVDARFPTIPRRRWRAIAGLSEGAYGSMNVALRNLRTFGIAESWSGYFRQLRTGPFRHASPAVVAANSPAGYVGSMGPELKRWPLHAFIYMGRRDPTEPGVYAFAVRLRAAGAFVKFSFVRGGHDWSLWRRMMPTSLEYTSRTFGAGA